jgi:hypothetical protein
MTTAKTKRWMLVDTPAERLLDEIGVPELEYYSAGEARAVEEALTTWPLLATVTRALGQEPAKDEPTRGAEQPLRVVESGKPSRVVEGDKADDATSSRKEAG